jgi:Uma2 family endonuclease
MSSTAYFSLAHYEHMVAVGAFAGKFDKSIELIRGVLPKSLLVRFMPIVDSEPEPDLVWSVRRDCSKSHPESHEVMLLVKVAESSLEVDRGIKVGMYAEAGIADYWIVNLIDEQIEVYRNPVGRTYQDSSVFRGDMVLSPSAIPTAELQPSQLFG